MANPAVAGAVTLATATASMSPMSSPHDGAVVLAAGEADRIRNRFNDLSAEFDNSREPLRSSYADILSACGEFAGSVDDGASKFLLSWNDMFEVCSTQAGLIAGNVNSFRIDLEALDRDSRTSITL